MEGGVLFLGLHPMAQAMTNALMKSGFFVRGFDVSEARRKRFTGSSGDSCSSLREAAIDAAVVVVTDNENAEYALFGPEKVIQGLRSGAVVVIFSLLPPTEMENLEEELSEHHFHLVNALLCGGMAQISRGTLRILAYGTKEASNKSRPFFSAISGQLHVFESSVADGSKLKMVNQTLAGIHLAAAAEAMALGAAAGINTVLLYDILSNAAGSSWIFTDRVPHMLSDSSFHESSLDMFVKDLATILSVAKQLRFPLPLAAVAQQQFLLGSSAGYGFEGDPALVKIWDKVAGLKVMNQASSVKSDGLKHVSHIQNSVSKPEHIGFIGLGAMGFGMATWLVHEGFSVCGYDVYGPSLSRFEKAGGKISESPEDAAKDAKVVVLMVTNESQVESVLYGDHGVVAALQTGSTVMVCSTVSPAYIQNLERRLTGVKKDFLLVDAPVSGGVVRAANGTLTMMVSGKDQALKNVWLLIEAMSEKMYTTEGGVGAASSIKMVNQLLAGVHIAAAAEGMAFGARLGLNTRKLFDTISISTGCSWMFLNRVPHMLDADYTPRSALDIFVKDLGIVLGEGMRIHIALPLASIAHQQFLLGSSAGWGREDDAAVVKVFETLGGVEVASKNTELETAHAKEPKNDIKLTVLSKASVLDALPPEWPQDQLDEICKANHLEHSKVLVVLDDDPTGTQTVHGIAVLTEWSISTIVEEFRQNRPGFFILTNSRALSGDKAFSLIKEICQNVRMAAASVGVDFSIVLRGDSTLRGHFPQELEAAASVLENIDAWILCPFFLEGGRFTIGDVHYVADGDRLVPAGQTEFALDAVFGYKSSNLCEWVEEKTEGRVTADKVASISIEMIRQGGPLAVCENLCRLAQGSICVVNAASVKDIAVFAAGMIQAEAKGKSFLCRTAAAFVSARMGIKQKAPLSPKDVYVLEPVHRQAGGLIVVGSYVPKTTKQVEILKYQCRHLECITVNVVSIAMASESRRNSEIAWASKAVDKYLAEGKDTLIMTSRELIKGNSHMENLEIGSKVSSALVEIVQRLNTRPRYILAKGGITSSDLATKALGARRAEVVGQAFPGVPLWLLGPESRHSGVPYIVFPGNVGETDTLASVVKAWERARPSLKELLVTAEKEGYALGAFNVYNLEGAMAVIAAAERENSPAILQIHPEALIHGGPALVACCVYAARQASVPIIVHLDHAIEEHEIVWALQQGFDSVMIDGSHLPFGENVAFTKWLSSLAHAREIFVEAELGRLSGTEDGLTIEEYEASLTDPTQAREFVEQTQIDALAICIGNVHGKYPPEGPKLDIELLKRLRGVALAKHIFLVLHGASGLPVETIKVCIELGCRKFNVNTELRNAYLGVLKTAKKDLVEVMSSAKRAMEAIVVEKLRIFGSSGKAAL